MNSMIIAAIGYHEGLAQDLLKVDKSHSTIYV